MLQSDLHFGSVIRGIIFLILVLILGTVWFSTVEGFTLVEGLYMTVITISTVGFKEVHELDTSGRIFVVLLIISGLTILTYTLGAVGRVIVEGTIERYVGRRKMLHEIEKMKNHYIICGHGRIGEILCDELQGESVPFVIIEGDPEKAEMLSGKGFMVVEGDATEDETLTRAGVKHAKGLVAVVGNNVDNLYITLSAREMCRSENPDLYILSRATDARASE
jgi:voltage-gated potassium channel